MRVWSVKLATTSRLPPAGLGAIRGDKTKATEALDVMRMRIDRSIVYPGSLDAGSKT